MDIHASPGQQIQKFPAHYVAKQGGNSDFRCRLFDPAQNRWILQLRSGQNLAISSRNFRTDILLMTAPSVGMQHQHRNVLTLLS
jgi:hypothetical protein